MKEPWLKNSRRDLEILAERLTTGGSRCGAEDRPVAVALYRLLARGAPVATADLAQSLDRPPDHIRATLSRWPGVSYDADDRVTAFWGLTLGPTPHRFEVEDKVLHTWCAWDSLFIPEILERTARVVSADPLTSQPVKVDVTSEGVRGLSPEDAVLSFLSPNARTTGDVVSSFCRFIHFFASPQSGAGWVRTHPGTFLLTVAEAHMLGRLTNARNYGRLALHER